MPMGAGSVDAHDAPSHRPSHARSTASHWLGYMIRVRTRLIQAATPERRAALYSEIEALSEPTASYYVRVAISTTIATFGLLANSTAVVIGAMLVAPLMGPIFGVALGLAAGDRALLRQASLSETLGALLAFAIAAASGLAPLQLGLDTEILSRTAPTLYDLVVALASGVAGAYAMVDERISASLPGVAISTALVPPLAAAGLCFSDGQYEWAFGAFLLFVANFVAIQLSAASVFIVFGMPNTRIVARLDAPSLARRFAVSVLALLLVGTFLTRTLVDLVERHRIDAAITQELSSQLRSSTGAVLGDFTTSEEEGTLVVVANVLTPQEFRPEQVALFENALHHVVDPRIHLVVRSLISKDFDRSGSVFVPRSATEAQTAVDRQTELLRAATELLTGRMSEHPGARLVELRREGTEEPIRLTAVVRAPTAVDPAQVASLEAALAERLGAPASLVVRTVLTRAADATRFLYDTTDAHETPSPEALARHRRIEELLQRELASGNGRVLNEVVESGG